jgi:hypothetical protein
VPGFSKNHFAQGSAGHTFQSRLNHLKADWRYLLEPISILAAEGLESKAIHARSKASASPISAPGRPFLQTEHLAVNLIFELRGCRTRSRIFHPMARRMLMAGHQFVNADCNRLSPTKTVSQSQ